ncbi:4'-phosphopantetheinyl transferase [Thecamonas trahens ATCC 50062]|uniref:holo-[acyl-carrier-protein] synthase n=1 Tax=Thecamonas trahens ATCC 50062 TaxID=461836 RepID=A0A0L0D4Y0_THETB|nr:4'-phosphopantetheinyl transferase [Thecamonas trahens ATCC 50062]KNC47116.1 4'-phosphopantetheinyl transferase [Thecamonas trahens ATCC 50062]|eukprot:XP_013759892.1 4'-phosphopantetheinyl transferase [Thecamonas trahens ATCC 50062]
MAAQAPLPLPLLLLHAVDCTGWEPSPHTWVAVTAALDPIEAARIARFVFPRDARASACGRLLLRLLLATVLAGNEADPCGLDLVLHRTERGRPQLADPAPGVDANISHHGRWVVGAAIGCGSDAPDARVGIDVVTLAVRGLDCNASETDALSAVETYLTDFASVLTPAERAALRSPKLGWRARVKTFFITWAVKEAIVKALGDGLAYGLANIDVALADGGVLADMELTRGVVEPLQLSITLSGKVADGWAFAVGALPTDDELVGDYGASVVALAVQSADMLPPEPIPMVMHHAADLLQSR